MQSLIKSIGVICGLAYLDSLEPEPGINGKILYRSKWFKPYRNKKPTLPSKYYNRAGVYIIRSKKTKKPVYVGYSANNLKKTLYRHFQNWNDRQQDRFIYDKNKYELKIYRTGTKTAARLEKYLIDKLKPRDNKLKYPSLFEQGETEYPYKDFFNSYSVEEETPF
jgi:excinuclease UvrABC nuclease subunit